ncbi:phosphatase PAP2 family protein [Allosphingosinicella deserti]|uniref:phosphatase PAP2 family protein n=1 Tax=Allosphingosinicella deserti TaxID=2116704 RepID=UPI000D62C018|nr:phosphatase PAP2 family protein [Sphingomonas deserti]
MDPARHRRRLSRAAAGPCFAADIGTVDASRFSGLMERLHAVRDANGAELGAVAWQRLLWQALVQRDVGIGLGISAMPSLHNAMCALYVFAFARRSRPLAIAAGIFALLVFVGSIHLGWHYAVDGIVAYPAVAAIWWAAGWYLRRTGYVAAVLAEELAPSSMRGAPVPPNIPTMAVAAFGTLPSPLDGPRPLPWRIRTLEPEDLGQGASV